MTTAKCYFIDQVKRNEQAEEIYRLFKRFLREGILNDPNNAHKSITASIFDNERERGYTIRVITLRDKSGWSNVSVEVSWAESRGSDSIVVYPFVWGAKDSDEKFKTMTKTFPEGEYQEALKFILVQLGLIVES